MCQGLLHTKQSCAHVFPTLCLVTSLNCHLKSPMEGFTPWKLANATYQGIFPPLESHLLNIYLHITDRHNHRLPFEKKSLWYLGGKPIQGNWLKCDYDSWLRNNFTFDQSDCSGDAEKWLILRHVWDVKPKRFMWRWIEQGGYRMGPWSWACVNGWTVIVTDINAG